MGALQPRRHSDPRTERGGRVQQLRAALRRDLRPHGRGEDGAEGQLGPLLLQHRGLAGRRDQPEHQPAVRRLQLERPQQRSVFQEGEQTTLITRFGGVANASIDPNLENSYTDEASVFVERAVMEDLGVRVGYVYKKDNNGWQQFNVARPFERLQRAGHAARSGSGQRRRQRRRRPGPEPVQPGRHHARLEPGDDEHPGLRGHLQDARVLGQQALRQPLVDGGVLLLHLDRGVRPQLLRQHDGHRGQQLRVLRQLPDEPERADAERVHELEREVLGHGGRRAGASA